EAVLPFDLSEATFMIDGWKAGLNTADLLALRIRQLKKLPEDIEKAADTLKKARFRSKARFEKKFERRLKRDSYRPGDLVLARNPRFEKRHDTKHLPRYFGPYEVHRRNRGGAYILKELDGTIIKETFAAFRLYPYFRR
ncbi:hypothetical protein PLICRDRAFT_81332, partial [Plicaturopsis crispa FD-325 SS-3]